jgi:hypothetical protein
MDLLTTFDPSTMAGLLNQLDLHLTSPSTTSGDGGAITSAADDDLIGWATQKALDIQQLFRVVAITVAVGVMVWAMFIARMALAKLLMLGATCALGLWFVFNIDTAQERVDNEINGAPERGGVVLVEHAPTHEAPFLHELELVEGPRGTSPA